MIRLLAPALVLAVAGCGDDGTLSAVDGAKPHVSVAAATALRAPLSACGSEYPDAHVELRFAGPDQLAAQVPDGVDVVAAAGAALRASAGELETPVVFASDERATYAAAVAVGSAQPEEAEAFVDDLLAGNCHEALLGAGFAEP